MCGCFGSAFRKPRASDGLAGAAVSEADSFKTGFSNADVVAAGRVPESNTTRSDHSSPSAENAGAFHMDSARTPSTCSTARDPAENGQASGAVCLDFAEHAGMNAKAARCWTLSCLEQLCKELCKRRSWRAPQHAVKKCWRAAMEADGEGDASAAEVEAIDEATRVFLDNFLASQRDLNTGRNLDRHRALPVHVWLHGLSRMSPARRFFQAIESAVSAAEPSQKPGERIGLLPQLLDRLSMLVPDDASTAKIEYRTLVCATLAVVAGEDPTSAATLGEDSTSVGAAAEHGENTAGSADDELRLTGRASQGESSCDLPLAPRGPSSSNLTPQHIAILELLPEPAEGDRRSQGGMSCEEFLCVALSRRPSQILLNCYNLANNAEQLAGKVFLGLDGIWHSGIVAHGREYWYGGHVHRLRPGQTPFGQPTMSSVLGHTLWSEQEMLDAIKVELLPRFTFEGYDVIDLNCNHFCDALSLLLVGKKIPDRIGRQAELASKSVFVQWLKPWARGSNSHSGSDAHGAVLSSQVPNSQLDFPNSRSQVLADSGQAPIVNNLSDSPRTTGAGPSQDSSSSSSFSSSSSSSSDGSSASSPRQDDEHKSEKGDDEHRSEQVSSEAASVRDPPS